MAKKKPVHEPDPSDAEAYTGPVGADAIPPEFQPVEPVVEAPAQVWNAAPQFAPYGDHGEVAETDFEHRRTVSIGGALYEHVSETPDGRWVYRKG